MTIQNLYPTPYTFNFKYTLALSPEHKIEELHQKNFLFEYPTPTVPHTDFIQHLQTNINDVCYYVGYVLRRNNRTKNISPYYFRASNDTLSELDTAMYLSQEYLFLDYDFGTHGNKNKWEAGQFEDAKKEIEQHSLLSRAIWYVTEHGLRFVFRLKATQISKTINQDERKISPAGYSAAYKQLLETIKIKLPQGSFDDTSPSSPFCFFRHPRSIKENKKNLKDSFVHIPQVMLEIDIFDYLTEKAKQLASLDNQNESLDCYFDTEEEEQFYYGEAANSIYHDPLFVEAREKQLTLPYAVWRAMGVNICAVTRNNPNFGFELFKQFSSWDTVNFAKTSESELHKHWQNIQASLESYGPITYNTILSYDSPLKHLASTIKANLTSAPAAKAVAHARNTFYHRYNKPVKYANNLNELKSKVLQSQAKNTQAIQNPSSSTQAKSKASSSTSKANQGSTQQGTSQGKQAKGSPKASKGGNLASMGNHLQHGNIGPATLNPSQGFNTNQNVNIQVQHNGLPSDEVKNLLNFTLKGQGENQKMVYNKDILNLQIILENDVSFKNRFSRNLLGMRNEYNRKEIRDELVTQIRTELVANYGIQYSEDDMWAKIKELCSKRLYNPIYDYLDSLPKWDGVDRIPELVKILGIDPNHLNIDIYKTYLRKWVISCVCRPLQWMKEDDDPTLNDKVDTVLVLKGGQGRGKSTFFKEMCPSPAFFSDSLQRIENSEKEASMHLLNYWMIEFAEFDGLVKKSSVEILKAFITRRQERFRPPYGRAEITLRRPSILVGTTNSDQFLNDSTGARRFWAIELDDNATIDIPKAKQLRSQIWAQAIAMFQSGETWHLDDAEQTKSNDANEPFNSSETWTEYVESWINSQDPKYNNAHGFTTAQVFEHALEMKPKEIDNFKTKRLKTILLDLGYRYIREYAEFKRDGQKVRDRVWVWRLDPTAQRKDKTTA